MANGKRHMRNIREVKEWLSSKTGRRCPFASNPFDGCFVAGKKSQDVDQAIYYCGENFENCDIFRRESSANR